MEIVKGGGVDGQQKYKYDTITVITTTGNKYTHNKCDYYIDDNILTVFRRKSFNEYDFKRGDITYFKFEDHFPMSIIERIECVER